MLQSIDLFVTNGSKCYNFHPIDAIGCTVTVDEVPQLECDHEEADTKIFVHAKHVAKSMDTFIIKSTGTDVFVIVPCAKACN